MICGILRLPLYGKAEPATTKTTMSVREMRQLLGLGKTDSYWLLHKNLFEVILINEKKAYRYFQL